MSNNLVLVGGDSEILFSFRYMQLESHTFQRQGLNAVKMARLADILKVISHPVRLRIIEFLEEREPVSVGGLREYLDIELSLLSHHINKMKDKGILQSYREGRKIYYSLSFTQITKIFDCMEQCDLDDIL